MKFCSTLFFSIYFLFASAQTPFPKKGELWRDDVVAKIKIDLLADDLSEILDPNNRNSYEEKLANFNFDNGTLQENVSAVGFRLRGNTSRNSQKKSFKVSFDKFVDKQKFEGVEDLNINGEHNDASISRAKICWDILREIGVPAPRANHVELYLNGTYFGLYANVEHIDDEFVQQRFGNDDGDLYKCTWPVDFVYRGENVENYRDGYELKNNDPNDYSDLIDFLKILNETDISSLPCELEKVFNVDTYLKVIAFDVFTGNWDGPIFNKNNCYLYKNTATSKFEYIPYDLDNTFGVSWFSDIDWTDRDIYNWSKTGSNRPIYTRLMQVSEYRERFSYYFNQFLQKAMNPSELNPKVDALKNLLAASAENDTYRVLDYGFSFSDFNQSFESGKVANHLPHGIKEYINLRHQSADDQVIVQGIMPLVNQLSGIYEPNSNELRFTVNVMDDQADLDVKAFYDLGGGNINSTQLFDDGNHNDKDAGDGVFSGVAQIDPSIGFVLFYAQATDNQSNLGRFPRCENLEMRFDSPIVGLVINEFMASNTAAHADTDGEFDDWIELYNNGSEPIDLSQISITDNFNLPGKFLLSEVTLAPDEYYLVWADENGSEGANHANFKLAKDGEEIGIYQANGDVFIMLDTLSYGQQITDVSFGRSPNGTGDFKALDWISPSSNNDAPVNAFELKNEVEFEVFPNPFLDDFSMKIVDNDFQLKNHNMLIVSSLGREVFKAKVLKEQIEVPFESFQKGVYFLILKNEKGVVVGRKMIEKI